jgi:hypothetical protein
VPTADFVPGAGEACGTNQARTGIAVAAIAARCFTTSAKQDHDVCRRLECGVLIVVTVSDN